MAEYKNQDTDQEMIYGRNSVIEALKSAQPLNKILVAEREQQGPLKTIIAMAAAQGVMYQFVPKEKLDEVTQKAAHQGVVAYIAAAQYKEPEDILNIAKERGEAPFLIILDQIQDPHNLGAIIRTADAVGAHGVIIPKRRSAPLTGVVSKSSAGALAHVAVARVNNIVSTMEDLKKQGVWIAGTDALGEKTFYQADLTGPLAIVIGSEGYGMGELVRKKCDYTVTIPMQGKVSSLNASVAAGVVLYEAFRQRSK